MKTALLRLLAFLIDYIVIVIYASVLFVIVSSFYTEDEPMDPTTSQLIGFFALTLPVFLYHFLLERSKWNGTIGKRVLKLEVIPNGRYGIFIRNLLKFLPWEIAHTGAHWLFVHESMHQELPIWNWLLLLVPQAIILAYFISIFATKGRSSLYDYFAGTTVTQKTTNNE